MSVLPIVVKTSFLRILKFGLLNIRRYAESKDWERCGIEANHLHNIPGFLENFSVDLVKFYIEIEVTQYIRETNNQVLAEIRGAWDELNDWLSEYNK